MENIDKMVEKVRKLLAKTDKNANASEHEVVAATLKAQKLMAEYNISMSEVLQDTKKVEIEYMIAKSKGYRDFRKPLSMIIATNFRCKTLLANGADVVFMGMSTDVMIAKETFEYLYQFIVTEGSKRYKKALKKGEATEDIFNSYATGFMVGLKIALDKQCRALMLITPQEVEDEFNSLNKRDATPFQPPENINPEVWREGKHDGETALNGKRIEK